MAKVSHMTKSSDQITRRPARAEARGAAESRFLDAAERLLDEIGYADITTRRLAEEANANQGLIHYYFGSMEELFLRVLERFTERLIARQRAMYASDDPYPEKWRKAMRFLDQDRAYEKVWWELQAMAWNRPEYRERVIRVRSAWVDAMHESVDAAVHRYGLEASGFSTEVWSRLIAVVNEGLIFERLSGVQRGHSELLEAIQSWLDGLERRANRLENSSRKKSSRRRQ